MNPVREQLLSQARQILRDPVEAEDVVQEALLALHEAEAVVRPDAWLNRVVRNRALDRLRSRRDQVDVDGLIAELPEPNEGTQLVAAWLPAFVDTLPEPYATAVREVDLEGMSQAAFAEKHGLSGSGARSRVQRGRALLHERLVACCPVRFDEGEVVDTGIAGCSGCS